MNKKKITMDDLSRGDMFQLKEKGKIYEFEQWQNGTYLYIECAVSKPMISYVNHAVIPLHS